jgi:hypothetical protein
MGKINRTKSSLTIKQRILLKMILFAVYKLLEEEKMSKHNKHKARQRKKEARRRKQNEYNLSGNNNRNDNRGSIVS